MAKKSTSTLGWISNGVGSRNRAGIVSLCWALMRPYLECCIQFWSPHSKDIEGLKQVQRRATKVGKMENGKKEKGERGKGNEK